MHMDIICVMYLYMSMSTPMFMCWLICLCMQNMYIKFCHAQVHVHLVHQ